jgi:hypothetical protein
MVIAFLAIDDWLQFIFLRKKYDFIKKFHYFIIIKTFILNIDYHEKEIVNAFLYQLRESREVASFVPIGRKII